MPPALSLVLLFTAVLSSTADLVGDEFRDRDRLDRLRVVEDRRRRRGRSSESLLVPELELSEPERGAAESAPVRSRSRSRSSELRSWRLRCQLGTAATRRAPFDDLQMRARLHPELASSSALFEVHDRKHMLPAEHAHHADCFFQVLVGEHGAVCRVGIREEAAGLARSIM